MDENRSSGYVLVIMKDLNLLIILYISMIMAYSLSGYIQENSALDFLERIDTIPLAAWKIPITAVGLYGICLLLLTIQSVSSMGLLIKVGLELGISFFISSAIGLSYTGIVLLVLADTLRYFPKPKWKFRFIIVICVFYLLIDYNLFSIYYKIIPLETYLEYFQSDVQLALLAIKNILNSLNLLVFLFYVILLVRIQLNEKERILNLNEQLNTANEGLRQANIRLGKYAEESEHAAKAKERNRLAMEIHDTLGHALTGIITGIEACITLMDVAPEATKEQLKVITDVARQGMTDVRRSIKALRPDALERLDLEKAITQMIEEMRCATNAKIFYHCRARLNCFNEDEENVIYRIVQESITNAIRHGKATQIRISIHRVYNMLEIQIRDNGIGCENIQKGFGLHHMEERLDMLQGNLKYNGENGFLVEAQVPIRWGTEEKEDD